MKAVGYQQSLPIDHPESLLDITLPDPIARGRDLLVEVRAVSVNPVDTKVRMRSQPAAGDWQVLGWDVAGLVRAVGEQVTGFRPGDRVWYAGAVDRPGGNAQLHCVDERLVGHMPASLDFAAAAALPLTAITAWEILFDRLGLTPGKSDRGESLLVVGAGGGVGSILVQLARRLTALTVIGTASRAETQAWVRELGAHHVIDHHQSLPAELARVGAGPVSHVASLTHTDVHFAGIVESMAPQGRLALIDDPEPIDVRLLKRKSLSLHWEMMFTRSLFGTPDMGAQGRLLDEVARLVDEGLVRSTLAGHFGPIDASNLRKAHALIESGRARGKIVLEGFQ
ncbi:MAG: zinc-binding alcohol dehydrogenase family protein [Rhodocyclaceae bacterium]|nr:zinc-binding alcohol dehydrogenase family protein [Rhodocyclaceae bacterium]